MRESRASLGQNNPEQYVSEGQARSLLRRMLVGKVPDMIRLRQDRSNYPIDIWERRFQGQPAVASALPGIPADDAVWQYVDRQTVLQRLEGMDVGRQQLPAWRVSQYALIRVILLQRFLPWVQREYGC